MRSMQSIFPPCVFACMYATSTVPVTGCFVCVLQVKPKVIEPLDYENVLVQRKTQILSDVLRDMLQFPLEDFEVSFTPASRKKTWRTVVNLALGVVAGDHIGRKKVRF